MLAYKVQTMEEERQRWLDAVLASLCAAYQTSHYRPINGVPAERWCKHEWCDAALDIRDRTMAVGWMG